MADKDHKLGAIHINGQPTLTAKLLDAEVENEAKRRERISRVTLAIEKMLLENDFTMGELAEVMDMFNARAHEVFSKTKIKAVKENYERQT